VSHSTLPSPAWQAENSNKRPRQRFRLFLWIILAALLAIFAPLVWGGRILISEDPLPQHAGGAVVLQGSFLGERARLAGAVVLLQQGIAERVLLSVPRESYWGQPISPMVESYIARNYGEEVANRIDFCESGADVDSTSDEAATLAECIRERGWRSVVLVTSDYHTRRAGIIWRKTIRRRHLDVQLSVHGVIDPEFRSAGWWHDRRSAKTWFLEFTKLCSMPMAD
jgi:uncharacterized SAM-binding protein YcdF (DUF218 family)